ncbi:MAG: restriction endonuclease [Planctomycetales bacterium]|nr:restriction endonuclease [Planctomycetales bacterium]
MGGIWFNPGQLGGSVGELVGYKVGLALTRRQFTSHLRDEPYYQDIWRKSFNSVVRIRSEVVEGLVAYLLFRLGRISDPSPIPSSIRLYKKLLGSKRKLKILMEVQERWSELVKTTLSEGRKVIEPSQLVISAVEDFGPTGGTIAMELVRGFSEDLERSPWSRIRHVEWRDTKELSELFRSQSLDTLYGNFLDQRFVDYLGANVDKVGTIHWRKFEGLAAEYFARLGFEVAIGPGSNDGNVDIRVWGDTQSVDGPPLLLVQCKRQKAKVGKVIVKALWADVQHEKARGGLIVTTSTIERGARETCIARGYNITVADRETLPKWLSAMRSPGKGVFMSQ